MKDFQCPKCGSYDDLSVCVHVSAKLVQDDDGFQTVVEGADHYWDPTHTMWCSTCGTSGRAKEFHTDQGEDE